MPENTVEPATLALLAIKFVISERNEDTFPDVLPKLASKTTILALAALTLAFVAAMLEYQEFTLVCKLSNCSACVAALVCKFVTLTFAATTLAFNKSICVPCVAELEVKELILVLAADKFAFNNVI